MTLIQRRDTSVHPRSLPPLTKENVGCLSSIWLFTDRIAGNSVAIAYLSPNVLSRPNLTVAINTMVEKILFDESGTEPRAIGVQVSKSSKSPKYRVRATREVILSSGTIATPQLLLLSGIGPQEELSKVGIKAVKDLSQVGKNYYDVSSLSTSRSSIMVYLTAALSTFHLALSVCVASLDTRLISSTRPFGQPLRCYSGFCSLRVR